MESRILELRKIVEFFEPYWNQYWLYVSYYFRDFYVYIDDIHPFVRHQYVKIGLELLFQSFAIIFFSIVLLFTLTVFERLTNWFFLLLNNVQFYFANPLIIFSKHHTTTRRKIYEFFPWIGWIYRMVFYILSTPVRLTNAIYYNTIVLNTGTLHGLLAYIILPNPKLRENNFFLYVFYWIFTYPFRFLVFLLFVIIRILESILYIGYETLVPTLTMYHGTSLEAAKDIFSKRRWMVGGGNFAGDGIYFAMAKRTAKHYARYHNHQPVIRVRVTIYPSALVSDMPTDIAKSVGRAGTRIAKWCLDHAKATAIHWRTDGKWWEFCLVYPQSNVYQTPWSRVRLLDIRKESLFFKGRFGLEQRRLTLTPLTFLLSLTGWVFISITGFFYFNFSSTINPFAIEVYFQIVGWWLYCYNFVLQFFS